MSRMQGFNTNVIFRNMVTPKVSIPELPLLSPRTPQIFRELKTLLVLQLVISPWLIINAQYQTLPSLPLWILVTAF